jgi:hypothetical protein
MRVTAKIILPSKTGFGRRREVERVITSPKDLYEALEEFVGHNSEFLRKNPRLPDIYKAGIRYESEPPGQENWLTYPILLEDGVGDCEDLACARVAKLRQKGEHGAKPFLYHKNKLWHVMVQRENGKIEDPSAVLGMYENRGDGSHLTPESKERMAMVAGLHRRLGYFR